MTTRTNNRSVQFARPFALQGLDAMVPAGNYEVETDEALVEGVSFAAWRRTLTVIHIGALSGRPGTTQTLAVDPADLDAALARDGEATAVGPGASSEGRAPAEGSASA